MLLLILVSADAGTAYRSGIIHAAKFISDMGNVFGVDSEMFVLEAVNCATTVVPAKVLYDFHHKKAMIVRGDGCYEYHMNHQDALDAKDDTARPILEARMLTELSQAVNIVETGHHHIDHMTQEIKTACASLTVYTWDLPVAGTTAAPVVVT